MKIQILELSPQDDVHSARDRLTRALAPRVLLVWPRHGRPLNRRLDLILLQRQALRKGIELGLLSHDPQIRSQARRVGIPCFDSLHTLPEARWEKTHQHAKPAPPPVRPQATAPPRLRSKRGLSAPARGLVFALSLLAVFLMMAAILPRATITIYPLLEAQSETLQIPIVEQIPADTKQPALVAHSVEIVVEVQGRRPTSGRIRVPLAAANGEVILTNLTSEQQTIPAGSGLRDVQNRELRFITLEAVELEAQRGAQVLVGVEALTPGPSGNLPPERLQLIDGSLGLSLSATNPDAISGGSLGWSAGVNAADHSNLQQSLELELLSSARQSLEVDLASDVFLIPGSLRIVEVLQQEFDSQVDQPAESLGLRLRALVQGQVVNQDLLLTQIGLALDHRLQDDRQALPETLSWRPTSSEAPGVDPDPQELDLIARRQTRPGQDSRRLIHELSGSALGDAHAMLAKLGGQSRPALISTHPGWLPWLPWLDANIEVQWAW